MNKPPRRVPSIKALPCLPFLVIVAALAVVFAFGAKEAFGQTKPVVRPELKILADTMIPPGTYIRTSNTASTQLRNYVARQLDSLSRVKLDTVRVIVPVVVVDTLWVVDTVYVPAGDSVIPFPPEDSVPTIPPDPPTGEQFPDTLRGVRTGDVIVSRPTLIQDLEIRNGSLRCSVGVVAMRPGSRLRLTGGDPNAYVGGGMQWSSAVAKDYGVWIDGTCALDWRGTPKTAWNRTGTASDWSSTDELWVTPVNAGDFAPRRYTLGSPVPRADPRVPSAEVVNVTRDIVIEGTGHIHVHSDKPQRIEYVTLRGLGVSNAAAKGSVLGRYALHLHMSGDGSRGTVIRGVAAIDSKGAVFVPHASHGITMADNVSLNSYGEALWWDFGQDTNDLAITGMLACGVEMPEAIGGGQSGHPVYELPSGVNMSLTGSVACGGRGNKLVNGFDWPEPTSQFNDHAKLVWTFENNVSHNNRGPGLRFWNNSGSPHLVTDFVGYRNGGGGIENGAYLNANKYRGITLVDNGYLVNDDRSADRAGIVWNNSAAREDTPTGANGPPAEIRGCYASSREGPAFSVGHRQLAAEAVLQIIDCTFVPAPGQPKVYVGEGVNPARIDFIRSGVTAADIDFEPSAGNEGSSLRIDNDGNGVFEQTVTYSGGQKRVSNR